VRVAVVGAGVVGLSAVVGLLEQGAETTCFERTAAPMGERSAGSSRIFRLAHADPELVWLAAIARDGFGRWSEWAGAPLISGAGCVISGEDLPERAAAMSAADATHRIVDGDAARLPARRPPAQVLVDPVGGVIDVDAVRRLLVARAGSALVEGAVYALDDGPTGAVVHASTGTDRFDAVLIAAGAGTSPLAAQVGIYTPTTLSHHVRFGFPLAPGPERPCWIDKPAGEPGTYQHQTGPGRWSVGGHVDPAATAWESGRDAAEEASREAALAFARDRLIVEPQIVESLYCTHTPDLGDGIHLRRSDGVVHAVYGENLFKFAPVLADQLATALLTG
ncbi:MAG TPA: FAD-dependent oxidoreductase, partial [Pseudonocardia sp.]|nr:FAD-dependent oxidoreductase [Pseudonocardia sp.]